MTHLRPFGSVLAAVICLGWLIACASSVNITTGSTATPPTITWSVTDRSTNTLTQYTGNTTLNVKLGSSYYITMHANSPSGVQTATIQPDEAWTCLSTGGGEQVGQNMDAFIAPTTVNQTAQGGTAQDELFIFQAITLNMDCNSGCAFSSGGYGIDATATNFANMQTSANLSVTVTP
jgi:hypothetical protein